MSITRTNFSKFKQFENEFKCLVRSNYCRITKDEYFKIIDQYYGTSAIKQPAMSAWNCSKCRFKELMKIAKEFFIFQSEHYDENGKEIQNWDRNPYKNKSFYQKKSTTKKEELEDESIE